MSKTYNAEAYDDMTVAPNASAVDSVMTVHDNVEHIIGALEDGKVPENRRGIGFTFGPLAGVPDSSEPLKTVTVTSAYIEMHASRTILAPDDTVGFKLCSAYTDGAFSLKGSSSPSGVSVSNTQFTRERAASILAGTAATPGLAFDSGVPTQLWNSPDNDIVAIIGDATANTGPDWKTTHLDDLAAPPHNQGVVYIFFRADATETCEQYRVYMHFVQNSSRDYSIEEESVQAALYEADAGWRTHDDIDLGTFMGFMEWVLIDDLPTTPGSFVTFESSFGTQDLVQDQWYVLVLPLNNGSRPSGDRALGVQDYIAFEGLTGPISFNAHNRAQVRNGFNNYDLAGYLGPPNYWHAGALRVGWVAYTNEADVDSPYVRLRKNGPTLFDVTIDQPYRWGDSGSSPDCEIDLIAILQNLFDHSTWLRADWIMLSLITYTIDASAGDQIQYWHSNKNTTTSPHLPGPTLVFTYDVTAEGAFESVATTATDFAGEIWKVGAFETTENTAVDLDAFAIRFGTFETVASTAVDLQAFLRKLGTFETTESTAVDLAAVIQLGGAFEVAASMSVDLAAVIQLQGAFEIPTATAVDFAGFAKAATTEGAFEIPTITATDLQGIARRLGAMEIAAVTGTDFAGSRFVFREADVGYCVDLEDSDVDVVLTTASVDVLTPITAIDATLGVVDVDVELAEASVDVILETNSIDAVMVLGEQCETEGDEMGTLNLGPAETNVIVTRGDTEPFSVNIKNPDGSAHDLTGYASVIATVDPNENPVDDTANLFTMAGVFSAPTTGVATFSPLPGDLDLAPADYYIDFARVDAASKKLTIAKGFFRVLQDIGKA